MKKLRMLPLMSLFMIATLGMQYNDDVDTYTIVFDEESIQNPLKAEQEHWEEIGKYEIYDPTEIEYFMDKLVISHPVVEEDVNLSLLLSEAISFHFCEITSGDVKNTEITQDNILFDTFSSIFDGYSLSPIDYNEHPWGGGYYVDGNRFYHDNYFAYGYVPEDLVGIDESMKDYGMIDFSFYISDTEIVSFVIFNNYNVTLSKITLEEEAIRYDYHLPYCLQGDSREVFHKVIDFVESEL